MITHNKNEYIDSIMVAISPIMEAFEITDYNIFFNEKRGSMLLRICGDTISINGNSEYATIGEVINWLFMTKSSRSGMLPAKCRKVIMKYWIIAGRQPFKDCM